MFLITELKAVYIVLGDTGKFSGRDNFHFRYRVHIYLVTEKRNHVKCKIIFSDI